VPDLLGGAIYGAAPPAAHSARPRHADRPLKRWARFERTQLIVDLNFLVSDQSVLTQGMNRKLLIPLAVGGVVLVAAIVLIILLRKESTVPAQMAKPDSPTGTPNDVTPKTATQPNVPNPTPAAPVATGSAKEVLAEDDPARTTVRDGMVITDHRKNPTAAADPTPVIKPPGGRLLAPAVANDLSTVIGPGVMACAKAIPSAARGKDPQVSAQIAIAIKAGKLSVTNVETPIATDVDKSATEAFNKCMQTTLAAASMDSVAEADIENYPIQLQFGLPKP
jgi:hypothetical protein